MKVYINSASAISPQPTLAPGFNLKISDKYETEFLKCVEPDYKDYIDPALIRRMGRVVKMGVAAAIQCLRNGGIEQPDAIITGTGLGCIEDTESFLNEIIKNKEQFLPPTSFIQSTHNTIAGQIALLLKCKSYNYAYVHRCFSFENALLDAMMMIGEKHDQNILLGGVDELTSVSYTILKRLGIYKNMSGASSAIYKNTTNGSIAGEGASFFLLSGSPAEPYATVNGVKTWYKPSDIDQTDAYINDFLHSHELALNEIDAVIMGYSGDKDLDEIYIKLSEGIFAGNNILYYKHLCGEYFTSTAFAFWLAANLLKTNSCPDVLKLRFSEKNQLKNIIIYNQFKNKEHCIILLSSC